MSGRSIRKKFIVIPLWCLLLGGIALCVSAAWATVKISAINDVSLGTYSGAGDLNGQDEVCVYNSDGTDYTLTVTASGGSFVLTSGINTLPFEVQFEGGSAPIQMTYGQPESFTGANSVSDSCGGVTNATLHIKIVEQDLLSVRPGSYSSTLTLLIDTL